MCDNAFCDALKFVIYQQFTVIMSMSSNAKKYIETENCEFWGGDNTGLPKASYFILR